MTDRHHFELPEPTGSTRSTRIGERIQRVLAERIQRAATDRGLGLVTLTSVDVSPDLRNARLYISRLGGKATSQELIDRLREVLGELRSAVAREVRLRHVPRLSLHFDSSIENAAQIEDLLRKDVSPASGRGEDGAA